MECPDCGEKMSRDNTKVYAWHCPKCNDDYKDDYVMGYWKGYADAKFAAQQSVQATRESLRSKKYRQIKRVLRSPRAGNASR